MTEGYVEFVLEKVIQVLNSESQSIHFDKDQLQSVYEGLQFLRQFLRDSEGERNHDYDETTTKDVAAKIIDVASKVDDTIDLVLLNTDDYRLRLSMSEGVEDVRDYDDLSARVSELANSFKPKAMQIHGVLSSFSCRVEMEFHGLLDSVICDFNIFKSRWSQINNLPSSLWSHIAEGDHLLKEISSIRGEVFLWLHSVFVLLKKAETENEDITISVEEICENLSGLYTRAVRQLHLLSDFLKNVILAYKTSFCTDVATEEMATIFAETLFNMRRSCCCAVEKFDTVIRRLVKEIESLKAELKIYKRHWSRVVDGVYSVGEKIKRVKTEMEIYKAGASPLSWKLFYETILSEMQFIKTEIKTQIPESCVRFTRLGLRNIDIPMFGRVDDLFVRSSSNTVNLAEKMFRYFGATIEAIDIEELEFFSTIHSLISQKFSLLLDYLESSGQNECPMVPPARLVARDIELIKKEMEIYERKLDLTWPVSQKAYDFLKLVYLAHTISHISGLFGETTLNFVDKIYVFEMDMSHHAAVAHLRDFASFMEGTISVMRELVIHRKRWLRGENICYSFSRVIEEIKSIKAEVMEIYEKMKTCDIQVLPIRESSRVASSMTGGHIAEEEVIVGFDDQKMTIIDFLTGEHGRQLKLLQIVGMPGLGKTTLARKVYNDPLIVHYFYICAWAYVSQGCRKRELLIRILYSAFQLGDKVCEMSSENLEEELYKRLKGKRYLIVMDDIWNIEVWNELKRCFPNDNNGSKIVFTSRLEVIDVAKSYHLRFLNEDESWILLQKRVFGKESCPPDLLEIGKQIATKCRGLPLAIVVLSGLLAKNEMTQHWWRHVAQSVSSYIASDQEQYMETLALSYNHLPHHLKPCFLYFGAFPEDYEIPVRKLIWLWIAEGFILQNQCKRWEEVAKDYLMDLIGRNLVVVSKKKLNGGIKTCHVHDFLRDLCLRKAQEENFLTQLCLYEQISSSSSFSSCPMTNLQRRICIMSNHYSPYSWLSYGYSVRSFLSFGHSLDDLFMKELPYVCQFFKLLRVLDLSSIKIINFPAEITHLLHLRYLGIHVGELEFFKPSMNNLWNLETLIVNGESRSVFIFDDFWKMANLRHLYAKQFIEIPSGPNDDCPTLLSKLQTLGILDLRGLDEQLLEKVPYLRKLKCYFMESWGQYHIFPKLKFLLHLEMLNVTYNGLKRCPAKLPDVIEFPPKLKSLTLSNFCLPWEQMSTIGRLPNLEALKLSYMAFEGPQWDTGARGFARLKFLKFRGLDIREWNASSNHFPNLRALLLDDCKHLKRVPLDLGNIVTLEMIELWYCSCSAINSVKQIENQQLSKGNDGLKILIRPYRYEDTQSEDEDDDADPDRYEHSKSEDEDDDADPYRYEDSESEDEDDDADFYHYDDSVSEDEDDDAD